MTAATTTFLDEKPINRMGFGAMQIAGPGVFGPPRDPGAARAVLRRAAVPLEAQLLALEDMRHGGKLDLIGLSNVDQAVVERALELVDVAEIQNAYSVINRHDDELITFARAHQIAFVPFGPLGSAYANGPARLAADATIGQLAEKRGATPSQIALAWLLARYDRMLLIPGTSSIAHLEENMAAIEICLDDADLAALDRAGVTSGAA